MTIEPALPGFEAPAKPAGHHCHALRCIASVPPQMHMCPRHWAMVPTPQRRALWAAYRTGQEYDKNPSAPYLRAAAACIHAVAIQEGHPPSVIRSEVARYTDWADRLDETDIECPICEQPIRHLGPDHTHMLPDGAYVHADCCPTCIPPLETQP